ncbi:hypothetical protein GCM10027174_06150 [Salinifilum aidingensis]
MSEAVTEFDADAVGSKLESVPADATPEQAAEYLFPDDEELRAEFLRREQALRDGLAQAQAEVEGPSAKALPAIVAAALPVIARCVWGSLSGAVIGQISNYVKNNELGKAEDLVVDACVGCITGVVPFISKPVARKISGEVAGAIIWLIVQMGPK